MLSQETTGIHIIEEVVETGADSSDQPPRDKETREVGEKDIYVDRRINEHFKKHGLPSPADFQATIRTLKSVFGIDTSRE